MAKKTNDLKSLLDKKNILKDSSKIENQKSIIKKTKTTKLKQTQKISRKSVEKKSITQKIAKNMIKKKTNNEKNISVIEHYELPYRYNETIVKILYQTPNTLFVYWDISDNDRKNYIEQYGENFFNDTYPVLIIHNDTYNYNFEIPIDDFANSWYLKVNDSKCNYRVELGRRPKYPLQIQNTFSNITDEVIEKDSKQNTPKKIDTNYIYISTSNKIELPNDHVLLKTNENNTIKFRNVKTKQEQNIPLYDIVKNLPVTEGSEIPLISKEILEGLYSAIYKNEDISFFENINNPSSGISSSSNMPHS